MTQKRRVQWWLALGALWVLGSAGIWPLLAWLLPAGTEFNSFWVLVPAAVLGAVWLAPVLQRAPWIWLRVLGALWALGLAFRVALALSHPHGLVAALGLGTMLFAFLAGLAALRWALAPGRPVIGVARTLVEEAMGTRLVPVFFVVAALWITLRPMTISGHDLLRYRLQTYLNSALWGTSVLLSLLSIVLSCWTVSAELSRRHIFLTMTKPVSRGQYLLGKWLGIMALNALLTAVCALGIYGTTRLLALEPARGREDRAEVVLQVLTARETVSAVPPPEVDLAKLAGERLARLQNEDPERYPKDKPFSERDLQANRNAVIDQYFSLTRLERKTYLFTGLEQARAQGGALQLRFKPTGTQVDANLRVSLVMRFNGTMIVEDRPDPETRALRPVALPGAVPSGNFHVLHVPTELIDEHGDLRVEVTDLNRENPDATVVGTISFDGGKDLTVLYRVGDFGPNLLRALLLMYLRLGFLAMFGLIAGSLLSFAVACLLTAVVYVGAAGSGFITEALQFYAVQAPNGLSLWQQIVWVLTTLGEKLSGGDYADAFKLFIRLFGQFFVCLIPGFSAYDGATLLTEGRLIPWSLVANSVLWVGAIWTGSVALGGWLVFRRRELARITV